MEVIIAILWYFQILFTGTNYTAADVDKLIMDNQNLIEDVQSNSALQDEVMNSYYDSSLPGSGNIIETWEDDEEEPIFQ